MSNGLLTILTGDALEQLRTLPGESVNCCVTSPPYWGLRDYGVEGQIGLERTPEEYVAKMVEVFRDVRRVLRSDGTCWINLGDSYNAYNGNAGPGSGLSRGAACDTERPHLETGHGLRTNGLKPKDLCGIPWRVAFALQADGWYLRQDIIWDKWNPMPESVRDRCCKSHEYIFLLSKRATYFFDAEAIKEPVAPSQVGRVRDDPIGGTSWFERGQHSSGGQYKTNGNKSWHGSEFHDGRNLLLHPNVGLKRTHASPRVNGNLPGRDDEGRACNKLDQEMRTKRSVWHVNTSAYPEAHFATFPPGLIKPCILAGCPAGGMVLDPFFGSGTTGMVALELGRKCIGIELNPEYVKLAEDRCNVTPGFQL